MGKVDKQLYQAKYSDSPIEYFKHLSNVESVKVCQDEVTIVVSTRQANTGVTKNERFKV
jgi:ethanolamine utilization protein EutP (predicted NTPase)